MVTIALVSEADATGKVKEIYADITATLGIDFVPNMYKAMKVKYGHRSSHRGDCRLILHGYSSQ